MADGEKTEPATPKRRRDAREQGDVANSKEIATVSVLVLMLMAAQTSIGAGLIKAVAGQMRDVLSGTEIHPMTMDDYHALFLYHGKITGLALLPLLLIILVSGVMSYMAQTGPMWAVKGLGFKLSRISFSLKKLFDKQKIFDLGKAAIKVGLIGMAAWLTIKGDMAGIYALSNAAVWDSLAKGTELCFRVAAASIVLLSFVAIADFFWVHHRHEKKLRMTKQEVRDERKQRDGDPQAKSRMRQMARDLTRARMIQDVAEADVVVTNPTHFAVALKYDQAEMSAPKVIAKGRGYVATRIREQAVENGVPIVENKPLAQILYKTVEVGREIPDNLYQAVAEVLAYVYRLRPQRPSAAGAW